MSFLSNLSWRYATKQFDASKKVSIENLEKILEAIRLTPTSFGLQAYHFYIVENQELLAKLQVASYNQPQIGTCSHLIIMCARNDLVQAKNEYFDALSGGSPEIRAKLSGYEQMVDGAIARPTSLEWTKKQVYIALGFALAACAELGVDSCAMEGFDSKAMAEILGLPINHEIAAILPIGYRALDEAPRAKVRFPKETLLTRIGE
ncbi:MAG: NAD(P)H-dependent oxidoreductase [Candidatus Gracilibacteria bacterium]|nr:NAD(P)H-dependent oxidoreductase [Candidatus Gracilibacteria bacterium]